MSEERKSGNYLIISKMFVSGFRDQDEENVPHEITNYYRADDGELYLYLPPYGTYGTTHKDKNINWFLMCSSGVGSRASKEKKEIVEIEYFIKLDTSREFFNENDKNIIKDTGDLKSLKNKINNSEISEEEKKNLENKIKDLGHVRTINGDYCKSITYNNVSIVDLADKYTSGCDRTSKSNDTNDGCCYLTFKAESRKELNEELPIITVYKLKKGVNKKISVSEEKEGCLFAIDSLIGDRGYKFVDLDADNEYSNKIKKIIDNIDEYCDDANDDFIKIKNVQVKHKYFLDLIQKRNNELVYSNMLAKYFNCSTLFNKVLENIGELKIVGEKEPDIIKLGEEQLFFSREVNINKDGKMERNGFIDLLAETDKYVLIIENKIDSNLSEKQIDKYKNYAINEKNFNNKKVVIFLLKPDNNHPEDKLSNEEEYDERDYTNILNYSDIFNALKTREVNETYFFKDKNCEEYYKEFYDAIEYQTYKWKDKIYPRFINALNKAKIK